MKRFLRRLAWLPVLALAYGVLHAAMIELAGEVVVLRTEEPDGSWHRARLWIVDDGPVAFLHGNESRWMRNLEARPLVEVVRGGKTQRYRATPVPGPHARVDALLREKYGLADRWVRFVGPDGPETRPVRLERIEEP